MTGQVRLIRKGLVPNFTGIPLVGHSAIPRVYFEFNGTNQYAIMNTDWTPNGLPFEVSVNAVLLTVDGTNRTLMGTNGTYSPQIRNDNYRSTWAGVISPGIFPLQGEVQNYDLVVNTAEQRMTVNGESGSVVSPIFPAEGMNSIAVNGVLTSAFFHGPIWELRLTDNSPIQDTTACFGNGIRYGEIPAITLAGDFEIEFDWIRQDRVGTGSTGVLGSPDGSAIFPMDTGRVGLESGLQFNWENGGAPQFADVYKDIAIGQHCHTKIVYTLPNTLEVFVDGVFKGFNSNQIDKQFVMSRFYKTVDFTNVPADSALQNIIITDITNSLRYEYKLDEGAGLDIINTDPGTAGPATNGTWTPDVDWQAVPLNSRHYKMNEGGGNIFFDSLNPAVRTTGPNLVTNGTFSDLSAWVPELGWTIDTANNRAVFGGFPTPKTITQALTTIPGETYIVDFDFVPITSDEENYAVGFGNGGTIIISGGEINSVELNDASAGHQRVAIFTADAMTEFGFAGPPGAQIAIKNVEVHLAAAVDTDAIIQNFTDNWKELE